MEQEDGVVYYCSYSWEELQNSRSELSEDFMEFQLIMSFP